VTRRDIMGTRGIYDTDGELFGYVEGTLVYTLDDEQVGTVQGKTIIDMDGEPMWSIRGDGLYTEAGDSVGYLGSERSEAREPWE
jgi:hypothetical protein